MQFLTGFLQFYWPDCSGNEDRKGLHPKVYGLPRCSHLMEGILFLQIVGWHC